MITDNKISDSTHPVTATSKNAINFVEGLNVKSQKQGWGREGNGGG